MTAGLSPFSRCVFVVGITVAMGCSTSPDDAPVTADDASNAVESFDAAMPADAAVAAPTLTELMATLFTPTCVLGRCHITRAPAGGLSFTGRPISPHEALVNAPSSEVPDRMRIVPFDPEASYLMEKITANPPTVGQSMPPMGTLPPGDIARIRQWILAGAMDN